MAPIAIGAIDYCNAWSFRVICHKFDHVLILSTSLFFEWHEKIVCVIKKCAIIKRHVGCCCSPIDNDFQMACLDHISCIFSKECHRNEGWNHKKM